MNLPFALPLRLTALAIIPVLAPAIISGAESSASQSPLPFAADSVAEREVRATDAARFAAMTRSDLAALDTLLGDYLTYIHNDGTRETKSVFLNSIRAREITYLALRPDSEVVRIYGTTAVADGRLLLRARLGKQTGHFTGRFLEVYEHRRGHWELVAWESVRLTPVTWEK